MTSSPQQSTGRRAAGGMAWTALALLTSKLLALISQVALGYFLTVETYSFFALISTAMIFVTGLQSPGVNKLLIQEQDRFDTVFTSYLSFGLVMGVLGSIGLLLTGVIFQILYDKPHFFGVAATQAMSIPLLSLAAILIAVLGIRMQFRTISMIEIKRAFLYYSILVMLAWIGAGVFTMALALTLASAVHVYWLRRSIPDLQFKFSLTLSAFWSLCLRMKWIILSSVLITFGQRGDYLVLGALLSERELGYYFFGFLLVTNLTIMIATGINQTLLPVFASLQNKPDEMRINVLRISGAVGLLTCFLCLVLVGLGGWMMHWIWAGKWDGAMIVLVSIAAALPIRMMATLGGVILEANGAWGQRVLTLVFDSVTVVLFAWLGASYAGLNGAALAVALQRIIGGIVVYAIAATQIQMSLTATARQWLFCFGPYTIGIATLITFVPTTSVTVANTSIVTTALIPTLFVVIAFFAISTLINRELLKAMIRLVLRRKSI